MSTLPQAIYMFNAMSIKIPTFFAKIAKHILKLIWNLKEMSIKTTWKKKSKARRFIFCDFKTYYKTTVIETMCYWHKKKPYRSIE